MCKNSFKQDTPRLGVQNVDCGKEKGICKTCIDREGAILWEVWEGGGGGGELTRCIVHSGYVHPEEGNFIRTTFLPVLLMSKRCFLSVFRGRIEAIVLYH